MKRSDLILVGASAKGVVGDYDHSITIGANDDFVIIYGPNGVGKTKFLEIINALSKLQGFILSRLPFDEATLHYSDGSTLSAKVTEDKTETANESAMIPPPRIVTYTLRRQNKESLKWVQEEDDFTLFLRKSDRFMQISDTHWRDLFDGDVYHFDELRDQYGDRMRPKKEIESSTPTEALEFIDQVPSFLIETQRLRTEWSSKRVRTRFRASRESWVSQSRINEQARTIQSLLNDAQTEHSRITQQLDRTFPNRVLGAASNTDKLPEEKDIRARYDEQNEFRSRLGQVASVSLDDELSLPENTLDSWALTLLNQYLVDADKKLTPFRDLLEKIELLEQLINNRLLNKTLQVTAEEGLSVKHAHADKNIALDSLSSGEQHEIILMIDLLFNVPRGAVVLIDEPEISLHVAWQLAFIPDVKKIAELAGFRFIVATHSPQIINDQWDRATRLGPEEASF